MAVDLNNFVVINAEPHRSKRWLSHQTGMRGQFGFSLGDGLSLNGIEELSKQSRALRGWADISKVDITARFDRHETKHIATILSNEDVLP